MGATRNFSRSLADFRLCADTRRKNGCRYREGPEEGTTLTRTKIVCDLLERHHPAEHVTGGVQRARVLRHEQPVAICVELTSEDEDGRRREIIVQGPDIVMFPRWLLDRTVEVIVRKTVDKESTAEYAFRALVTVEGLSPEDERLWWWRRSAIDALRDEGFPLTRFQEDACVELSTQGAPPTSKQRVVLGDVVRNQRLHRARPTLERRHRAQRFAPRSEVSDPVSVGDEAKLIFDRLARGSAVEGPSLN